MDVLRPGVNAEKDNEEEESTLEVLNYAAVAEHAQAIMDEQTPPFVDV